MAHPGPYQQWHTGERLVTWLWHDLATRPAGRAGIRGPPTGPAATNRESSARPLPDRRLQDLHRAGDHRLLIGGVERFAAVEGEPLLFVQGSYRTL